MWWITCIYLQLYKFEEMVLEYNAFTITFDIHCCRITFRIPKKSNHLVGEHVVLLSCNATIVCLKKYSDCFKRFEQGLVVSTRKMRTCNSSLKKEALFGLDSLD